MLPSPAMKDRIPSLYSHPSVTLTFMFSSKGKGYTWLLMIVSLSTGKGVSEKREGQGWVMRLQKLWPQPTGDGECGRWRVCVCGVVVLVLVVRTA